MPSVVSGSKAGAIAYRSLKDLVTTYQLRPSERLQSQVLAEELGISATPVREALLRLLGEGLIACNPHRGFHVKPIDLQEIHHCLDLHCRLLVTALQQDGGPSIRPDVNIATDLDEDADPEGQIRATDLLVAARSGNRPLYDLIANISDKIRFVIRGEIITAEGRALCLREARAIRAHLEEDRVEAVAEILTEQSRRRTDMAKDFATQVTMRYVDHHHATMSQEHFVPLHDVETSRYRQCL